MKNNSSKFARRYDREFKENAVALAESGRTLTEVSRNLDVSHWVLNRLVARSSVKNIPRASYFWEMFWVFSLLEIYAFAKEQ